MNGIVQAILTFSLLCAGCKSRPSNTGSKVEVISTQHSTAIPLSKDHSEERATQPNWQLPPKIADYDKEMVSRIRKQFEAEAIKLGRTGSGKVVVEFSLHSDGHVSKVRAIYSDFPVPQVHSQLSEKIITAVAPFAPWPDEMKRILASGPRSVRFTFNYGNQRIQN